jgi:hypothetical protein
MYNIHVGKRVQDISKPWGPSLLMAAAFIQLVQLTRKMDLVGGGAFT